MNSGKENQKQTSDTSNSPAQQGGKRDHNPYKKENNQKEDYAKRGSEAAPSKHDKQDHRNGDDKKNADGDRQPDEQDKKFKDMKKEDNRYNDKTERT
ncbi:MAG: hypothetical protein ACK5V3_16820 [Bdellovibrionales bacterium]